MINSLNPGNILWENARTIDQVAGLNPSSEEPDALLKVSREFEALFVKQMLDSMRRTVNRSPLIPKGRGEAIFEDMLYEEYAKKISRTANLGIATMMYRQFSSEYPLHEPKTAN